MSRVQVTERDFEELVNGVLKAKVYPAEYGSSRAEVVKELKPYFDVTPDNVAELPKPYDRTHGGRVSVEGPVRDSSGMPLSVHVEAIPYDGAIYLKAQDVVEFAQRLQTAGEGFQSFITHLLGPTMAGQALVGREGDES